MPTTDHLSNLVTRFNKLKGLSADHASWLDMHTQLDRIKETVLSLNAANTMVEQLPACLLADMRQTLPPLFTRHEYESEVKTSMELLARESLSRHELDALPYSGAYHSLVSSELALCRQEGIQSFTHLGCGPLPMTLLYLALSKPDWSFTGVDINPQACEIAEELIIKAGLQGQIRIVQSAAADYALSADTLPMLASLLLGKSRVYQSLASQGIQSFLVRDAAGTGSLVYLPSEAPDEKWKCVNTTGASPHRLNISRYFERCHVAPSL